MGPDPRDRDDWDDRDRRPRKKATRWIPRILVLTVVAVIVIGGLVGGLDIYHKYQARYHPADYAGPGTGDVTVQVMSGDTAFSLAPRLLQLGVIASTRAFTNAAESATTTTSTSSTGLEAGYYQLHEHMQASLAFAALTNPKNVVQTTVTIPEGKRAVDVIAIIAKKTKIPLKNFQQVLAHPSQLGLPSYAGGKVEGYLFPATYAVVPHETALQILQAMVQRFNVEAQGINLVNAAKAVDLTPDPADHRGVPGPGRGRLGQRLPEDRRGHPQPPRHRHAPAVRQHGALRARQVRRQRHDQADPDARAVQHVPERRAAGRADLQPGRRGDPGRPAPGPRQLPVLPHQARWQVRVLTQPAEGPVALTVTSHHMKAAVLGKPIAHSLSPVLHRAAYEALGFADWTYELVECDERGLAAYVESRGQEWAGLSLTMPLKRTVLPLLDHVDHLAAATGGANTVVFRPEGRYGYNTDVQGIVDALTEAGAPAPGSVTILGAGATACSALAAVGELGATGADIVARDPSRADGLLATADRLGLTARLRPWAELADGDAPVPDLLISTVPAGAADEYSERLRLTRQAPPAVLDVVYHPWPTPLARAAAAAGSVVASGYAMLLHQAAAQVELMTGKPAPLEAMREAGERELARRAGR